MPSIVPESWALPARPGRARVGCGAGVSNGEVAGGGAASIVLHEPTSSGCFKRSTARYLPEAQLRQRPLGVTYEAYDIALDGAVWMEFLRGGLDLPGCPVSWDREPWNRPGAATLASGR